MNASRTLRLFCLPLLVAHFVSGCDSGQTSSSDGSGGNGGESATSSSSTNASSSGSSSTSSSTSSGATSSSASSSGSSGGPVTCQNAPLCDDFESAAANGPPDAAKWQVVSPNCSGTGAIAVDNQQAHSGSQSMRVDGKGGYCNHVFVVNTAAVATLGNAFYGRFYVRPAMAQGNGHTTFMTMHDNIENKDLRMGGQSQILMWNRESDDATLPVLSPTGISKSVALAANQWSCVEFHVDGTASTIQTWVNGTEVTGLVVDGTATLDIDQAWINQKPNWKPTLVDFKLGWEDYAGQDMTLWFDDVALASARIGCP